MRPVTEFVPAEADLVRAVRGMLLRCRHLALVPAERGREASD